MIRLLIVILLVALIISCAVITIVTVDTDITSTKTDEERAVDSHKGQN